MDSSTENSVRESGFIVKTKLPAALPLLPRGKLYSQAPKSILEPVQTGTVLTKQTQPAELATYPQELPARIPLPFDKLSQLLEDERNIVYNILGEEPYSQSDASFGFQYIDKDPSNRQSLDVKNTGHCRQLSFQSRFEGGNLLFAYRYTPDHYLLVVRPDYNTISYCQWFYFEVCNETSEDLKVTFEIINMTKSHSLFSKGMRIMAWKKNQSEWLRTGDDIRYEPNEFTRFASVRYRSLKWKATIESRQCMRFAYSQPYLYSDLNRYLDEIEHNPLVRRSILCRTTLRNRIDQLTISSGSHQNKKVIVMLSRTHPAESVSSFVMRGAIDFLTSDKAQAKLLRDKYVFKIIPMVNPDGVILGNSRCSLRGVDLNRCWDKPVEKTDPEIYHIKRLIMGYAQSERLVMFCDLHGHSKKKNIFVYGCHDRSQPLASRQLPFILSKLDKSFSFEDCNFKVDTSKQGTARVTLWRKLRIPNIFTLQSSFCSATNSNMHLDEKGYKQMGENLCKAINIYFTDKGISKGIDLSSAQQQTQKIMVELRQQLVRELHDNKSLAKSGMVVTSGSQSQREDSNIYDSIKNKPGKGKTQNLAEYAQDHDLMNSQIKTERAAQTIKSYRKKFNTQRKLEEVSQTHSLRRETTKSNQYFRKIILNPPKKTAVSYRQDGDSRCHTQNFANEYKLSRHRHKPLNLVRDSFKEQCNSSSRLNVRSEKKVEKVERFVPQIINFNFEEKFSRTTLEEQMKSKLGKKYRDQVDDPRNNFMGLIEHRKQVRKEQIQSYIILEWAKRKQGMASMESLKKIYK